MLQQGDDVCLSVPSCSRGRKRKRSLAEVTVQCNIIDLLWEIFSMYNETVVSEVYLARHFIIFIFFICQIE